MPATLTEASNMENKKSSFRWVVLSLLFFVLFFSVLSMNCIPPLFSEIQQQIPLTKAQMGTVMGMLALASLFFAPIGGALTDKIGCRWSLGGAALLIAGAGACRTFVGSVGELFVCMFFLGAGMAVCGPSIPKALGTWFPPQELAKANGICFSSMGIGGAIAMATAASFMSPAFGGWRGTVVVLGGLCLAMGILWMILYRDKTEGYVQGSKEQNVIGNFKKVLKVKDIWIISIYYGLNMVGLVSIITLLPLTLEENGVTRSGEMVSIMMGTTVVFNILGGVISDKVGKRKPFLILCAVIMGLCIPTFVVFKGAPLVITLIVAGAALGTIAPVMMAIPVELKQIGTALTGTAVGVIFMIGNTGGFFGPVVSGKLMDMTKSPLTGFLFMGVALIISAFVVIPLTETGKKRQSAKNLPST